MTQTCPLCAHGSALFYQFKQRVYYQCGFCAGIFLARDLWPSLQQEKSRYLEHLNDVTDARFQAFVSPITDAVKTCFTSTDKGLDFGAGHAPVITHTLQQHGYDIAAYDPLFFPEPALLTQRYHYICSCEVIEHFHRPAESFALLRRLLKPQGHLLCMTELYHEGIDFHRWNYKNDPTHVFIYHRNTISYIADKYIFLQPEINKKFIHLICQ